MFVVTKTLYIEKEHTHNFINRFQVQSPLFSFKGFIKREILINRKNKDHDIILIKVHFGEITDYYRWEGSKEHIMMHKQQKNSPIGLLRMEKQDYELLSEDIYEAL